MFADSLDTKGLTRLSNGWVWLFVASIGAGLYYRYGLVALGMAWQTPEYSHGPLIPVISALLFLRQYDELDPTTRHRPKGAAWPGLLLILIALAAGAFGMLSRMDELVAYALILWIGGAVLLAMGWTLGRQFWPSVLHLLFMLPLPGLLHYWVSTKLQFASSFLGVAIVQALGIPVILEGNVIDLGSYRLHVAEACSGLRYLFPILSFSYVIAVIYRGPGWHKMVILLAAAPIAILMNTLRIAIVAVLTDRFGAELAIGASHLLEGWVIFLACLIILVGMVAFLITLENRNAGLRDALDLDLGAARRTIQGLRHCTAGPVLWVGAGITLAAALASTLSLDRTPPKIQRDPLALFPPTLSDWQATGWDRLQPDEAHALGADDYLLATYTRGQDAVEFFVAYYADQSKGGIHSPKICLPGGGWEVAEIGVTRAEAAGLTFPVTRAIIQNGTTRRMVYYWFEQHGRRSAIDWRAKLWLVWDGLRLGRTDGALVRLVTPIAAVGQEAEAETRLNDMLTPIMHHLGRFVPETPS